MRSESTSKQVIIRWLADLGIQSGQVEAMKGDVSSREYFRVEQAGSSATFVVARYPPELRDAQRRFRLAHQLLEGAGIPIPRLLSDDPESGLALLEDLGPRTLYEQFSGWEEARGELHAALQWGVAISRLDKEKVAAIGSPALDARLLRRELEPVLEFFSQPGGLEGQGWSDALGELCSRLGDGSPLVPCHRDFMARNLISDRHGGVVLLDFQDLRLGPAAYDLASLLNDSFFATTAVEEGALAAYCASETCRLQYARAVVQRCLKAVGTFLRFAREGDRRHLPLIPATLGRARRWMEKVPELDEPIGRLGARWRLAVERMTVC